MVTSTPLGPIRTKTLSGSSGSLTKPELRQTELPLVLLSLECHTSKKHLLKDSKVSLLVNSVLKNAMK